MNGMQFDRQGEKNEVHRDCSEAAALFSESALTRHENARVSRLQKEAALAAAGSLTTEIKGVNLGTSPVHGLGERILTAGWAIDEWWVDEWIGFGSSSEVASVRPFILINNEPHALPNHSPLVLKRPRREIWNEKIFEHSSIAPDAPGVIGSGSTGVASSVASTALDSLRASFSSLRMAEQKGAAGQRTRHTQHSLLGSQVLGRLYELETRALEKLRGVPGVPTLVESHSGTSRAVSDNGQVRDAAEASSLGRELLPYVVMTRMPGVDLARWLAPVGRGPSQIPSREWVLKSARGLCKVLIDIHKVSAHGNIAPSNILVAETGEVSIVDFGSVTPSRAEDRFQACRIIDVLLSRIGLKLPASMIKRPLSEIAHFLSWF